MADKAENVVAVWVPGAGPLVSLSLFYPLVDAKVMRVVVVFVNVAVLSTRETGVEAHRDEDIGSRSVSVVAVFATAGSGLGFDPRLVLSRMWMWME